MNSYLKIAIVLVVFVVGFFLGRKTIDVGEKIEYIAGETVIDTVLIPDPIYVEIPSKPEYIYKYDTLIIDNIEYISEKVDTSAIIQDYILTRTYAFNVFNNDTLGKFDISQQIGYNKLLSFDYTFTPITRQITRFKEPVFTPFITMGYSTNRTVLGGVGAYYRRLGVEYLFNIPTQIEMYNFNQNKVYHTFKFNYKL